jgi:hypothetical protein
VFAGLCWDPACHLSRIPASLSHLESVPERGSIDAPHFPHVSCKSSALVSSRGFAGRRSGASSGNRAPFREWIAIVHGRSFGVELVYDTSFIHSPIPLWVVSSFMVAPLVLSLFVMMPLLISLIATVAQNTRVRVSGFSPPLLLFLVFSACSHSEKYLIGLSYVK